MDTITVLSIALGLSMDAFAVSVTSGITIKNLKIRHAAKIAFFFGFFQLIMPVAGWLAGLSLRNFISGLDHWLAFGLLGFVGGKMIWESFKMGPETENKPNPLDFAVLLMLSIATSIDALAVGLTFSFLNVSIAMPVLIIGLVTFLMSLAGVFIGERFGHIFENKIETAGGIILTGIGVKILLEHTLHL